ncbi:MAG: hypothetical protein V4739_16715 [Pseudomonadota bacterium]
MNAPLPVAELLDAGHRWADWASSDSPDKGLQGDLIGWGEFDWTVNDHPELAWQALTVALDQPRMQAHLGKLAAGPLEDLLAKHGPAFIDRVESLAGANAKFAWMLGSVWQCNMLEPIWHRVQAAWNCRGPDGHTGVEASPVFKRRPDGVA